MSVRTLGILSALVMLAPLGCKRESPPAPSQGAPPALPPAATPAPAPAQPGPAVPITEGMASLAPLVESVKASVVNVEVVARVSTPPHPFMQPGSPWEEFFGRGMPREQIKRGQGSGFIIDPAGLVLTNNHVIEGATGIRIRLDDGRSFEGEILGRDPLTDVALVRLKGEAKDLPAVKLGDSDALRVGDWVVAIGNPFGLASSVSAGIVSAKARNIGAGPYDEFLQTDAAINPGNSGGPLFNLRGEVVGINTAIVGGGTGIGFAVPSNLVRALWPRLQKEGHVTRGYLGVAVQDLTPELAEALGTPVKEGAIIGDVNEGTPAADAGLKSEDVVTDLDGKPITSASALTRAIGLQSPGTEVTLGLYREGQRQEVKVKLGTRPDFEGVGEGGPGARARSPERLGLMLDDLDPRLARARGLPPGAVIAQVVPGSPAERAGLAAGMVVVEVKGTGPIASAAELRRVLRDADPGDVVVLRVQAGEQRALRALRIPE